MKEKGFPDSFAQSVFNAVAFHGYLESPKTLEGEIVLDTDKLDWIGVERWKACINRGDWKPLKEISGELKNLKDAYLTLEASRKIYEEKLPEFVSFVSSVKAREFRPVKQKVLYGLKLA